MAALKEHLDKRFLDVLTEYNGDESDVGSFRRLILALLPVFSRLNIDYAFGSTLAMRLHGGMPAWSSCDVRGLITQDSWQRLRQERVTGIQLHVSSEGKVRISHGGYQAEFRLCDSLDGIRETIYGVPTITLTHLIGELIPSRRRDTRNEIVRLIQANRLDRSFEESLPEAFHGTYRRLVQKARASQPDRPVS
jgi:hypothetical protein